ncbi:MAG: glycoside hydrolase family 32 protein [Chitinophagaceae bacterium]
MSFRPIKFFFAFNCLLVTTTGVTLSQDKTVGKEKNKNIAEEHRPQIHFTPRQKWMNDPNGLVFHEGMYHLFYQHYPDSTVWGPMHWGHATSSDMVHWKHEPIALFPDSIGMIFSGSIVIDKNNTSGFGKNGQVPLVAIFTHHDVKGEKAGANDFQKQSLAYSLDNGKTWTKYSANPVLKSPGIRDFRDPKVMWYEPGKRWIMSLAVFDRIHFYSSANLKEWVKESEFGEKAGAHGGVWECPDLFSLMDDNGKQVWVLLVSINPGGANKGSATQYFLGNFDGKHFKAIDTGTKWLDYGPDDYAGVTWFNTGERRLFIGWMSNWLYGQEVPTIAWRSAMTLPRKLKLKRVQKGLLIASEPVNELASIHGRSVVVKDLQVEKIADVGKLTQPLQLPARFNLKLDEIKDFALTFSNDLNEKLVIGYDKKQDKYYIDRSESGKNDFQADFAARLVAPRFTKNAKMDVSLIVDVSSVELFADGGLSVMTAIFFPNIPYTKVKISSTEKIVVKELEHILLKGIW